MEKLPARRSFWKLQICRMSALRRCENSQMKTWNEKTNFLAPCMKSIRQIVAIGSLMNSAPPKQALLTSSRSIRKTKRLTKYSTISSTSMIFYKTLRITTSSVKKNTKNSSRKSCSSCLPTLTLRPRASSIAKRGSQCRMLSLLREINPKNYVTRG